MSVHYFPSYNSVSHESYISPNLSLISSFSLNFHLFSGLVNAYNYVYNQRHHSTYMQNACVCVQLYKKWQNSELLCISLYIKAVILIKNN